MIIAAAYYFKGSQNTFWTYKNELAEVGEIIRSVDSAQYKTKQSQEKTMLGTMLYDPVSLNDAFEHAFTFRKWEKKGYFVNTLAGTIYHTSNRRQRPSALFGRWILSKIV